MSEPTRKTSLTPELIEAAHQAARQCPPLSEAAKARLEGVYMRMDVEARQRRLAEATARHLASVRDTGTPGGTPGRDTHPDTQRGAA